MINDPRPSYRAGGKIERKSGVKEKVLVLGSGFIASRLKEELGFEICDRIIRKFSDAETLVNEFKPNIIINAAGYTGKNVDYCELDKENTLLANSFLPILLAEAALRNNIRLVHISSGCIYHYDYKQDSPIGEERVPDFFGLFYSRSKIYSEQPLSILASIYPILIVRIRIPLDNRPNPKNLLDKLINYKKVIDVPNSVTYIPDFVRALKHLIDIQATGLYNVVNNGGLRYPELLDIYRRHVPGFKYEIIDYKKLKLVRTNLILSTEKLEKSGFRMPGIHEVLEKCVEDYLKFS